MNDISFSIIVPVYNIAFHKGENLFSRCVESILNQTYYNIEVILVDDGSTDNAPQMCDDYAIQDSRVVVIHKANGGLSSARNMGMRIATGEYILFVDADDAIDYHSCEVFVNIIRQHPDIEIISSNAKAIKNCKVRYINFTPTKENVMVNGGEFIKMQMSKRTFYTAAWLPISMRKFLLENMLFFAEDIFINEDNEWSARLYLSAQIVATSNFTHYFYYILDISLSSPKDDTDRFIGTILYCYELEKRIATILDDDLRNWMMNFILTIWFYAFIKGRFYRRRYDYLIHRDFIKGKPRLFGDKIRCFLFSISPYLFCYVSKLIENIRWWMRR